MVVVGDFAAALAVLLLMLSGRATVQTHLVRQSIELLFEGARAVTPAAAVVLAGAFRRSERESH